MTDDEPVAQFLDRNRNETSPESEMAWKTTLTAASPSLVSGPKPDSTFSTPPSASRCFLTDWTAGPLGAEDPSLTNSNSGFNYVAFTAGNERRGYLLHCDVNDPDQVYSPVRDWTENIISKANSAQYEVRQISSSDLCFGKKYDGKEAHLPAHPVNNLSSSDTDSASSTESSTVSLPSPKSTPISSSTEALPTFMSPIETVKPCPQNCRCHRYADRPISSTNNSNMTYPLPDLLNYTTPDQFSITSSTTSMTSPLVCPRPFQPPSIFHPFRPGFIGDEDRYSAPSSASGSSFVSSAAEASDIQPGPNKQGRAYPVQVVPSALLTSLVHDGLVGRGTGNELTTPTTASTITTSTSEMERTQQVVPTSFPPNCNIPGDDVVTRARPVASSHTSYYYPQAYPTPYLTRFQMEFPSASRLPPEHLYLPSEYSNHSPVGNPPHPGRPPPPGYHHTPGYHAHPPPDYPSSLILSRLLAPRSLTGTCDPRMAIIPPHPGCFPSLEDSQPRTSVMEKVNVPSVEDKEKVPSQKRRPNRRPGRRLVDQYPDLLPVIAWCIKHLQAATSYSLCKPNIPVKKIHEIVVECIPGIKERGGIGMDTIRRLASDARRKMRDESVTPSSTSLLSQVSHTVVTENNSKHLNDSISTSFKKDDDSDLPRAPPESILRSIMKLVENMPEKDKHSRSTATTTASSTTGSNMTSRDRKLAPDGNTVAVSSDFYNDTREGSTFQSLVDGIIEGEVEKTSRKSEALCSSSSAGLQAQLPVKPSHFEPEIAAGDKRVDGAKPKDSTKCSDYDSDDDIMVIDEASTVGQSEDFVVCSDLSVFL